jgi:transcriptional regulator with XRE-family HTH domain
MTNLRKLLSHNMKERRKILNITQHKLAERVGTSAYYIAMIETLKKYPSPEMLQRIAAGLEIDTPELFSMASSYPEEVIRKFQRDVLKLIKDSANSILDRKLEQLNKKN